MALLSQKVSNWDCGGNSGAFEECDGGDYGDDLCILNNGTLWSGERNFERSDQCSNGHPVFKYIEYSATTTSLLEGLGEVDAVNFSLYLHYHREAPYSDSNETVAQWIISMDEVSVNALALCEEEDVRDCAASSWLVDTVHFEDDEFEDGMLLQILDEAMTVNDRECDYAAAESETDSASSGTVAVVVVVAVLIVAALCLVAFWRMNRGEKDLIQRKMGGTTSPNAVHDDSGDEAAGAMVSPQSVEVLPMNDGGVNVTATRD